MKQERRADGFVYLDMHEVNALLSLKKEKGEGYSVSENIRDLERICSKHPRGCACEYCWFLEEQRYVLKGVKMGVLPKGVNR